ncbi:MAG: hypothetical protein R2860_01175 [Desulfobacterales bacterium]
MGKDPGENDDCRCRQSAAEKENCRMGQEKGLEGGYAFQKGNPCRFFTDLPINWCFQGAGETGLDRCKIFVSTAAPISMDTLEFF